MRWATDKTGRVVPRAEGTFRLGDLDVRFLVMPDGSYRLWGVSPRTLAGTGIGDIFEAFGDALREHVAENSCPRCQTYDPSEADGPCGDDSESHCRSCADTCSACRQQSAAGLMNL